MLSRGVSVQGGSVQGGLCQTAARMVMSGQYAPTGMHSGWSNVTCSYPFLPTSTPLALPLRAPLVSLHPN